MAGVLLSVENLNVEFTVREGVHRAVRDVSLAIHSGEALGLVGESGSGKTVTALSLMRLLQEPPARITGGAVRFDGRELLGLSEENMRRLRGSEIAMIFQEPMTSLNPIHTCGAQIMEPLMIHQGMGRKDAEKRALELLALTGIPSPAKRLREYPHQLSGGMRQRVMIAMALSCRPKLLIADEPTTALDVTIQAQILELMKDLRRETGSAVILITHDLGVIAETCDRAAVMYAGEIVETAPVKELFRQPLHPYSEALLFSIPSITRKLERLFAIKGTVPSPFEKTGGCSFAPRCEYVRPECGAAGPPLTNVSENRQVRCPWWRENAASGSREAV